MNNIIYLQQKSKIKTEQETSVFDERANPDVHHDTPTIEKIMRHVDELDEEGKRDFLRYVIKIKNRSRPK